jgi:hypothetical protein
MDFFPSAKRGRREGLRLGYGFKNLFQINSLVYGFLFCVISISGKGARNTVQEKDFIFVEGGKPWKDNN